MRQNRKGDFFSNFPFDEEEIKLKGSAYISAAASTVNETDIDDESTDSVNLCTIDICQKDSISPWYGALWENTFKKQGCQNSTNQEEDEYSESNDFHENIDYSGELLELTKKIEMMAAYILDYSSIAESYEEARIHNKNLENLVSSLNHNRPQKVASSCKCKAPKISELEEDVMRAKLFLAEFRTNEDVLLGELRQKASELKSLKLENTALKESNDLSLVRIKSDAICSDQKPTYLLSDKGKAEKSSKIGTLSLSKTNVGEMKEDLPAFLKTLSSPIFLFGHEKD